jgi:hypothetical protein
MLFLDAPVFAYNGKTHEILTASAFAFTKMNFLVVENKLEQK